MDAKIEKKANRNSPNSIIIILHLQNYMQKKKKQNSPAEWDTMRSHSSHTLRIPEPYIVWVDRSSHVYETVFEICFEWLRIIRKFYSRRIQRTDAVDVWENFVHSVSKWINIFVR